MGFRNYTNRRGCGSSHHKWKKSQSLGGSNNLTISSHLSICIFLKNFFCFYNQISHLATHKINPLQTLVPLANIPMFPYLRSSWPATHFYQKIIKYILRPTPHHRCVPLRTFQHSYIIHQLFYINFLNTPTLDNNSFM